MPDDRLRPIIYVRGYASGQDEIEATASDPYDGLNVGSTKIRQDWKGRVTRHYFESPLVRLMKDHGYRDVYSDGADMPADRPIPDRPVVIYRYYERASRDLGTGQRQEMERLAGGLAELILDLRDRVCGDDDAARRAFRVHLVAHSMGGLICRCMLQNDGVLDAERLAAARTAVDKVATLGTPHNGIDLQLIGNVPGFLTRNNADNFNRARMRAFLGLPPLRDADADDGSVATLAGKFDPDRFFTVVGTNHRDYTVGRGIVRGVVGEMSDGLVRIANATVSGPWINGEREVHRSSPRAFVHRSHSGHYGLVNSEEAYQNIVRFLHGNVRVDGILDIRSIALPAKLERIHAENAEREAAGRSTREIRASYHFECTVRVRGGAWDLHRRTVADGSAVFATFDELLRPHKVGRTRPRRPHLFSTFLDASRRVKPGRRGLGFTVDLGVLVPQYSVDNRLWFDDHYEGGYLFREKINLEAIPDADAPGGWRLKAGVDSRTPNRATSTIHAEPGEGEDAGVVRFRIPVRQASKPGIDADLVLEARGWS